MPTSTSPKAGTATAHLTDLAAGETAGIASQLSAVAGYRYVDPPAEETDQVLSEMDIPGITAIGVHGVVADDSHQNTTQTRSHTKETGLLILAEFDGPVPAGTDSARALLERSGQTSVAAFGVNGVDVRVLEYPDEPDSRWVYMWFRHGVLGYFDGATRPETERWVRAYLATPEHQPLENDRLAAQLVPLPGYVYANWWVDYSVPLATTFSADGPVSVHAVADSTRRIGTLMLAQVPAASSPDALARRLAASISTDVGAVEPVMVSGVATTQMSVGSGLLQVWVRDGIAGAFLTSDRATATAFLQPYLAAGVR